VAGDGALGAADHAVGREPTARADAADGQAQAPAGPDLVAVVGALQGAVEAERSGSSSGVLRLQQSHGDDLYDTSGECRIPTGQGVPWTAPVAGPPPEAGRSARHGTPPSCILK
jgi:hypothetical protein